MDQSFLREIIKDPDNDDPRLIYADYLEETGDPLGELIRIQCDLAKMTGDDRNYAVLEKRQFALLKKHKSRWLGAIAEMTRIAKIYRGFVRDIVLGARQFIAHHRTLFQLAPIRNATVVKVSSKSFKEFAECESLARLDSLKLSDVPLETAEFRKLFESPYLTRLKRFSVGVYGTNVGIYHVIGKSRLAEEVCELELSGNAMQSEGMVALLQESRFRQLETLSCDRNGIDNVGMVAIANTRCLTTLRTLHIGRSLIGPDGMAALANSANVTGLRTLTLNENYIQDSGLVDLFSSRNFGHLSSLGVARNHLTDDGFTKVATSNFGGRLRSLDAGHNQLGSDSLAAIVGSSLRGLERLVWDGNRVTDVGTLADLATDRPLKHLSLAECQLRNNAVAVLADAAGSRNLRTLILTDNRCNDAAGQAILESENLHGLMCLMLDKNNISRDMQSKLRKKYGAGVCVFSRATH
ncbi:MAG: hypothetical protein ACI9HK_005400 [Pirellulaceae bacterium]|jgi:uncharacterized protein (TIGR02996 family)